ncbi:hypothetical protein P154DRAFT_504571 [Amniculicola lignicola CBS 123094]|uniref:Uncharacterized protein n=1 Tax=Amniculicola lignicola CBS 123094 TaxID=1392246 RepID=A0A6A5VT64_9PLEO|nr:hypothetical protein P154DRAFT_504571 [Amniculicola lignicola CBS 123094]
MYLFQGTLAERREEIAALKNAKTRTVNAVRINCDGDVEIGKRPRFEAIQITDSHPAFKTPIPPLSERLGLPVHAYKIPGNGRSWFLKRTPNIQGHVNQPATFLNRGCNPERRFTEDIYEYGWSLAPMQWQNEVGSIIVARKDKKPLLPEHTEALCEFSPFRLSNFFQYQLEADSPVDDVLREIIKPRFQEYYDRWKAKQANEEKRNQVSPYAV